MFEDLAVFNRFACTFQKEEVIFFEHEPGDRFYLIQKGRVKIVKIIGNIEKIIDILNPGEFFGEMAILEEAPRTASIIALEECTLLEFNKENFATLVEGNPQIGISLLKIFARRIYDQKRRFQILTMNDKEGKIADVFVLLDEMLSSGEEDFDDMGERTLEATSNDIAHWAGIAPDECRDILEHLQETRKIQIEPKQIIVKNINEMKRFVSSKRRLQEMNESD
ncbi:MAG: Crp/Fnr family transcriptional regulator [Spirochaetales bacterium]|nr:Crp/Fnr family transcriptional regulator [Spirochaetales bacterium]